MLSSRKDLHPRQLAQTRASGTSPVSAILKKAKDKMVITSIVIANTTAGSVNYSIYLDKNGSTYDQTTALFYAVALAANSTAMVEFTDGLPFDSSPTDGNLAVQTSSSNALTFTISGQVVS